MSKYLFKYPFVFFLLLAVALRFFSFFPSVIDHDESTYLQIGKELLAGKTYFVDVIDVKPPGIFYVTAIIQAVFGDSIFLFRLLCSVYIALTALFLFRLKFKISGSSEAALAAGILYILMLSVYTYYGISVNTELFTNLLAVSALLLFISGFKAGYFFGGLLLGMGFIIKHTIVFDYLAFGSFFLFSHIYENKRILGSYFMRLLSSFAGFILPVLFTGFYYYSLGQLNAYLFYTFEVPAKYPVDRKLSGTLLFVLDFLLRFLPVTLFFFIVLFKGKIIFKGQNLKILMITWCGFVMLGILYSGKFFGHYFIQIIPPFCLVASGFFHHPFSSHSFLRKAIRMPVLISLLAFACGAIIFFQKKDYYDKPDIPLQVSRFIEQDLKQEDQVYVHGYHQVVYYLLDRPSPSKYVHRSLIFQERHIDVLNIDREKVARDIIDSRPRYIIEYDSDYFGKLGEYKQANYILVKSFQDKKPVDIYKRKE